MAKVKKEDDHKKVVKKIKQKGEINRVKAKETMRYWKEILIGAFSLLTIAQMSTSKIADAFNNQSKSTDKYMERIQVVLETVVKEAGDNKADILKLKSEKLDRKDFVIKLIAEEWIKVYDKQYDRMNAESVRLIEEAVIDNMFDSANKDEYMFRRQAYYVIEGFKNSNNKSLLNKTN